MNSHKFGEYIEYFKTLIEIIAALIVIVPVSLVLIQQGITAVIPFWGVLIITVFAILLGYLGGRSKPSAAPLGIRNMWPERRYIPAETWNTFTAAAQSEVWLFGVAELGFADDQKFHQIVADGTARGCHYRFLLLDPSSAAAKQIDAKEGGGQQVQGRIRRALGCFLTVQKHNTGKRGTIEIRVYATIPHVSIVRSDDELLVTQYMWPLVGNSCYTHLIQNVPGGIFKQYSEYFEVMWQSSKSAIPVLE